MQDIRGLRAGDLISDKEYIGRRLAARPTLVGAWDQIRQRLPFDLRDFEETRPPHDISLDWLGKSGLQRKVLRALGDQAARMFGQQKPPQTFAGWVYLQTEKVSRAHRDFPCRVVSSPERPDEPDHPEHNPYHCLIKYEQPFSHPHLMAQHVYLQFQKKGAVEIHPRTPFYLIPYEFARRVITAQLPQRRLRKKPPKA
jgi:hypothetical protein